MTNVLRVVLDEEKLRLYEYIAEVTADEVPTATVKKVKTLRFLTLDIVAGSDEDVAKIKRIVSESAYIFWKYDYFSKNIRLSRDLGLSYYCLMGAILAVSAEEEIETIGGIIKNSRLLNLAGIENFRMDRLYEDWECLADIFNRLIASDRKASIADLALYFLTLDAEASAVVTVTRDPSVVTVDGVKRTVPRLADSVEQNTMLFALYNRPTTVNVKDTSVLSEEFVRVIRKLGE